jgi:hypothetical protein
MSSPLAAGNTHFLRIPRNIRSLLVSSGDFSAAFAPAAASVSLEVDEGAVLAGESSKEPELVDAII